MPPDVNSAQVVIKRQRVWAGSLLPWTVWLDGEKVGTLRVGGSLTILASPGEHAIMVSNTGRTWGTAFDPLRFTAEAGERIELVAEAAAFSGRAKVRRRDPPPGQATAGSKNRPPGESRNLPVQTGSAAARPAAGAQISPAPTASTVIEGTRYEVPLGQETRGIDNSKASSSTTRVVRLTREWAKTYALDVERARTVRGSAGLNIHFLALKAEAERTLTNTYSVTSAERETFEEEVTLNIAGHTKSEIRFFWKEIRQKGIVQISGLDFEVQIPYEVVVGLTFDQQQVDTL